MSVTEEESLGVRLDSLRHELREQLQIIQGSADLLKLVGLENPRIFIKATDSIQRAVQAINDQLTNMKVV